MCFCLCVCVSICPSLCLCVYIYVCVSVCSTCTAYICVTMGQISLQIDRIIILYNGKQVRQRGNKTAQIVTQRTAILSKDIDGVCDHMLLLVLLLQFTFSGPEYK